MSAKDRRVRRIVRWFPPAWRERYGDEFADVLQQSMAEHPRSHRRAADVARHALGERLAATGLVGRRSAAEAQARSGALLVLCGWASFTVAGVGLQKYSEHWSDMLGPHRGALASGAFALVQGWAAIGTLAVLAGAVLAAGALGAWARGGGLRRVRRQLAVAGACDLAAIALTGSVIVVSHVSGPAAGKPATPGYAALALVWWAVVVVALATTTRAVVAMARRLELGDRVLRLEVAASCVVALSMAVILGSAALWWTALPDPSRSFLEGGGPTTWADPVMLLLLATMAVAVGAAAYGSSRAVGGVRRLRAA